MIVEKQQHKLYRLILRYESLVFIRRAFSVIDNNVYLLQKVNTVTYLVNPDGTIEVVSYDHSLESGNVFLTEWEHQQRIDELANANQDEEYEYNFS